MASKRLLFILQLPRGDCRKCSCRFINSCQSIEVIVYRAYGLSVRGYIILILLLVGIILCDQSQVKLLSLTLIKRLVTLTMERQCSNSGHLTGL